jgi:hypothetical protein
MGCCFKNVKIPQDSRFMKMSCIASCTSPLSRVFRIAAQTLLPAFLLLSCLGVAKGQGFGMLVKSKTTLQRKLPALVQLPAGTVNIVVTGHSDATDLTIDFRSMLGSELLKDDPRLSITDQRGDSTISCEITAFDHPPATTSTRPGVQTGKTAAKPVTYTRVTGLMRVSFQARTRSGKTIGSDNILAKYDEEFDTSGNSLSGGITGAFKNGISRIKGGKSENMNPPTDAELKTKLITSAVDQIVVELVNTRETLEVLLAKGKGPMDEGVKDAEGGLWSRALEAWETMPPLPRPVDDAYRLYDLGVANEALAYASEDYSSATKFLDEAAIDYGKAIDSNPAEKYFIEPQKRIESALAHDHKLQEQQQSVAPAAPPPAPRPTPPPHSKTRQHPSGK